MANSRRHERHLEETTTILAVLESTRYNASRPQLIVESDEERTMDFSQDMDAISRVRRFLVVGNDRNTYHAEKQDLAVGDVDWLLPIINEGEFFYGVNILRSMGVTDTLSTSGILGKAGHMLREAFLAGQSKGPTKQGAVPFTLALLTRYRPDWATWGGPPGECLCQKVQAAAFQVFLKVCRDSESLFAFANFSWVIAREPAKLFANTYFATVDVWDNAMRDAIKYWYLQMPAEELATQIVRKCRRGSKLSHRTLLMKANINPDEVTAMNRPDEACWMRRNDIFRQVANRLPDRSRMNYRLTIEMVREEANSKAIEMLHVLAEMRKLKPGLGEQRCDELIRRHGLKLEHVNPELLNSAVVWAALLEGAPVSDLLTNLPKVAALGVLDRNYRDDM
ncbi:CRE-ROP-1 protein [Aphelenchoides avenae]|nr:CRE-ROP-1 protein [Aphelenchus avenae]